jgi:hypothetical protein
MDGILSRMSRQAAPIVLSTDAEATLEVWARSRSLPLRQVQRAQIIQLAASGVESQEIARVLGVSRPTVQLWRERFLRLRTAGLEKDAPRPGRLPRITENQVKAIVDATLHTKPTNATHWTTADDGESAGGECGHGATDLATAPAQAPSDENLQAEPRQTVPGKTA